MSRSRSSRYFQSHGATAAYNTEGPATQRDAIVIALIGVTVSVVGAAIFLRYSLAQFLRFWLARLIYEQQAATDRIVESRRALTAGVEHLRSGARGTAASLSTRTSDGSPSTRSPITLRCTCSVPPPMRLLHWLRNMFCQ